MADLSINLPKIGGNIIHTITDMLHAIQHQISVMVERKKTRHFLENMSNRELEDIGVHRADINYIIKNIK